MAELRDIFRAPNGDEFHCKRCLGDTLWVAEIEWAESGRFGLCFFPSKMKSKIEGPYRIWQEK